MLFVIFLFVGCRLLVLLFVFGIVIASCIAILGVVIFVNSVVIIVVIDIIVIVVIIVVTCWFVVLLVVCSLCLYVVCFVVCISRPNTTANNLFIISTSFWGATITRCSFCLLLLLLFTVVVCCWCLPAVYCCFLFV